ncbi:MAG TPA: M15 family metallopeptidase [Ruminiclostridium sp.]
MNKRKKAVLSLIIVLPIVVLGNFFFINRINEPKVIVALNKNIVTEEHELKPSTETVIAVVENNKNEVKIEEPKKEVKVPNIESIFEIIEIDKYLAKKMEGVTYFKNNEIELSDLRFLRLTYWSFNETSQKGEIIVNKLVANAVLDIFKELYDKHYLIAKVNLMDNYLGNDSLSMSDNNSSAFNYRVISGSTKISNHGYGLAIDINPMQNPYVDNDFISPEEGITFLDRSISKKGMIVKNDDCYNAFVSRGWVWGGNWNTKKDYQHFEFLIKGINK